MCRKDRLTDWKSEIWKGFIATKHICTPWKYIYALWVIRVSLFQFLMDPSKLCFLPPIAQEGQLDCLIWLTKTSATSPDIQTDTGMTPSHVASQEGRMECLRYLVKAAHAQSDIVDKCGCGLLHFGEFRLLLERYEGGGGNTITTSLLACSLVSRFLNGNSAYLIFIDPFF